MSAKSSLSEHLVERIAVLDAKIERLKDAIVRLQVCGAQTPELERSLVLLLETRRICEVRLEQISLEEGSAKRPVAPEQGHDEIPEPEVIELNDASAVRRWCSIFGCNEADLMQAVYRVGPLASAVSEHLEESTDRARGVGADKPVSGE
jgi:hypothetical protein